MVRIAIKRLLALPLILLAVAAMTFSLVAVSPFDPVREYAGGAERSISDETRRQIVATWGLDKPFPEQFARWATNVARGDLGESRLLGGRPVAEEIASRVVPSMVLIGSALVLVLVGGLVAGTLAAAFRDSWFDWLVRSLSYYNVAAPSFWVALLSIYVFSIWLGWLPAAGTADLAGGDLPFLQPRHLLLPVLVLAATQYAHFALYVRNMLLEVLREDYVRFAEAQGVGGVALLLRHALPNALIPFATLVGGNLSELVGGAVLVESIFAWPGLGRLAVQAATVVDLPLLLGITLMTSVFVVLGNLLADLAYRALDPRVRLAA